MKISTSAAAPATANVDMLAVAVAKPVVLEDAVAELDRALGGTIGRLVKAGEIRGAAGQVTVLHTEGQGVRARRVAVVGLGKRPTADAESVRNAAGAAVRSLAGVRGRTLAFVLDGLPVDAAVAARCAVDGAVIGSYRFDRFKTSKTADRPKPPTGLVLLSQERAAGAAGRRAAVAAEAVNRARDLQHMPPNLLGPQQLVERARAIAAAHPTMRDRGLGRERRSRPVGWSLRRRRPGVQPAGPADRAPPPLRAAPPAPPATLCRMVGKGLTFDSGGYSLKPPTAMTGMKFDMSGAAAVLEASDAIAQLQLPLKFVTVVGATENMIDTNAMRVDERCHSRQRKDDRDHQHRRRRGGWCWPTACTTRAPWARPTWSIWPRSTGGVVVALGDYTPA
jgi:leucyl aminopeptidase